jgi:hypothetical protein
LNRTQEGLAEFEGALEAEPGNLLALSLMARYAIHSGDIKGADAWMTRIRRPPRFPASDLKKLLSEYESSFGHPFTQDGDPP